MVDTLVGCVLEVEKERAEYLVVLVVCIGKALYLMPVMVTMVMQCIAWCK